LSLGHQNAMHFVFEKQLHRGAERSAGGNGQQFATHDIADAQPFDAAADAIANVVERLARVLVELVEIEIVIGNHFGQALLYAKLPHDIGTRDDAYELTAIDHRKAADPGVEKFAFDFGKCHGRRNDADVPPHGV